MADAKKQNNLKSSGTDVPDGATVAASKRPRKAIEPDQRTLTVRSVKRSTWTLVRAALDGDPDALAILFGNTPPAPPIKPVLSDADRTDVNKVLAHVDALNAYSESMSNYQSTLDKFNAQNLAHKELRTAVNAALEDIPLRNRKS